MFTTVLLIALAALFVLSVVLYLYQRGRIRELESEIETLRVEHQQEVEKLHRTYRDRIDRLERDLERIEREGHLDLADDLFDGLDALTQALDEARANDGGADDDDIVEGLEMVQSTFRRALERHELAPITPETQDDFDPERHEALRAVEPEEVDDEAEPGTIVQCHRPGYRFGDRVLRPASVDVTVEASSDGEGEAVETSLEDDSSPADESTDHGEEEVTLEGLESDDEQPNETEDNEADREDEMRPDEREVGVDAST